MEKQHKAKTMMRSNVLGGALLLLLGIIFLAGQLFDIHLGSYLWPFTIIIPGVFLFFAALALEGEMGKALAMVSGIVTMVGAILWVQSVTEWWASWAYAWALVAPTGPGLGMWLLGSIQDRPDRAELVGAGKNLVRVGLFIFVVAAVFLELIIGVSGHGLGSYGLPLLLIGFGLFLLLRNMRGGWQKA